MASRPLVGVYTESETRATETLVLPGVFLTPIRPDVIQDVHTKMNKNKRQPYSVSKYAGHQTSAESWGTGRAVSRIPRVPGGGTHRAGQGAFGNMCRGGRMFAPTKTWRKWHVKIPLNQKRYALCSALAASAVPALVMSRGHRIGGVPEIPLVVDNKVIDTVDRTKNAVALLKALGVHQDVNKVMHSKKLRPGKGKMRNRRYVQKRGPLVIYSEQSPLTKAFRNIPGIELCCVTRLNLLQLAPGGHLGRLIIWTRDAFAKLDALYGTHSRAPTDKKNFRLPRSMITNPDVNKIIQSEAVQSVLRLPKKCPKFNPRKKNPLKNLGFMIKLNPYAKVVRRKELIAREKRQKEKAKIVAVAKEGKGVKSPIRKKRQPKNIKTTRAAFYKTLLS